MDTLDISNLERFVEPWLPKTLETPHVTVTWAQSLDAKIAAGRGLRTKLSGPHSLKMTHYLRSKHAAIVVGRDTVLADNPRLNCRYPKALQTPVPVILDSDFRWPAEKPQWSVLQSVTRGEGKPPIVIVSQGAKERVPSERVHAIEKVGGSVVEVESTHSWIAVIRALASIGLNSIMIEGGSTVLRTALDAKLATNMSKALILTQAPCFLGAHGVEAAPSTRIDIRESQLWVNPDVQDSVICGWL